MLIIKIFNNNRAMLVTSLKIIALFFHRWKNCNSSLNICKYQCFFDTCSEKYIYIMIIDLLSPSIQLHMTLLILEHWERVRKDSKVDVHILKDERLLSKIWRVAFEKGCSSSSRITSPRLKKALYLFTPTCNWSQ